MKARDFIRITLFILGFILLNNFFSDLFVGWSRDNTEYLIAHREFSSIQDQINFVVLGDSHPQKSVAAAEIDGAYTLATSGENYIITYYVMKDYLQGGGFHPKVAVVQIDPHGFLSSHVDELKDHDPAYWNRYVNYLEVGSQTDELGDALPIIFKARFPLLGAWDSVAQKYWPTVDLSPEPQVSGFVPEVGDMSEYPLERQERLGFSRVKRHFSNVSYMDSLMVAYFYRLVELLDAYNVQVALVWYPVTAYYYEAMGDYIPVEDHLAVVENILEDQQVGLILDYHDMFFAQPEYFSDSDHLNVNGAEILTNLLVEDLTEAGLWPPPAE